MTPVAEWRWFGCAGHLIVASNCRFHLCTQVGRFLVSTVGEYVPDETIREIDAQARGVVLEGRGDARLADYMRKIGFQEIGYGRTYETMVFRTTGDVCHHPECACGLPSVNYSELEARGYTSAAALRSATWSSVGSTPLCKGERGEPRYVCQSCGLAFTRPDTWSDAQANAEARERFGVDHAEDPTMAVVCDDCYRQILDWLGRT